LIQFGFEVFQKSQQAVLFRLVRVTGVELEEEGVQPLGMTTDNPEFRALLAGEPAPRRAIPPPYEPPRRDGDR